MTNSFCQTLVNPNHVKYTATLTLFGLWEWVVMPMGLWNSSATHQHHVTLALKDLVGKICHVYLNDIIIWSSSVTEHQKNIMAILTALRAAQLYCSSKKLILFATEIDFLGHHISDRGIKVDVSKVARILDWPALKSTKHVQQFLGLVRYIVASLPALAEHILILMPLTCKEFSNNFPVCTNVYQYAFDTFKWLVVSHDCLTMIDHELPGENKIFVTCNTSKWQMGAILSFGKTWESAQPVAFESWQLNSAECNYPVHEQEILSILRAVKKWRVDLLWMHINIYTDYKTLQNFDFQCGLSQRQAHWMEYLSQYKYLITYINGERNTVADALSCLPESDLVENMTPVFWQRLERDINVIPGEKTFLTTKRKVW